MAFILFSSIFAWGQETRAVILFTPFVNHGLGTEEARFIESLVQAHVSELGQVIFFVDDINPGAPVPDFILSGRLYMERSSRGFELVVQDTRSNEVFKSATRHRSSGDLVLRTRSLVESVFRNHTQAERGLAVNEMGEAEIISERSILGTWRGETGIEIIRLQAGGRGMAFFSSGAQMALSHSIEDNTLFVWQNSPNNELFYHHLPQGIARQLALEALPMRWELQQFSGGTQLAGIKISSDVRAIEAVVPEIIPETVRNTVWTR